MPGINLWILIFDILCSEKRPCIGNVIQVKLYLSLHAVMMPTLKGVSGVHLAGSIRSKGVHVSSERNGLSPELRFLAALASWILLSSFDFMSSWWMFLILDSVSKTINSLLLTKSVRNSLTLWNVEG